jgi:hypothetical protein
VTLITDGRANKGLNPVINHSSGVFMKSNTGGIDRILRIVAGLVLLGLTLTGNIGVWGWIGVVPLATGLIGWCPAYTLLGFNTCPMKK